MIISDLLQHSMPKMSDFVTDEVDFPFLGKPSFMKGQRVILICIINDQILGQIKPNACANPWLWRDNGTKARGGYFELAERFPVRHTMNLLLGYLKK
jgi:hypothetical protein